VCRSRACCHHAAQVVWLGSLRMETNDSSLHAQAKYTEALDAAPPAAPQRAVYFANRAAAALKLQQVVDGTTIHEYAPCCGPSTIL
jgi:hypothetical protein